MSRLDRLLEAYTHSFYGYGSYSAPYWFIGIEEGGGEHFCKVGRRLICWDKRGRQELDDLREFHYCLRITKRWRGTHPNLQSTWKQLIRVLLCSKGKASDNESVRAYQSGQLGRRGNETCLMELLPLPSQSTNHWLYAEWSSLPHLKSRKLYERKFASSRAASIQAKIQQYKPKLVVMYGRDEYAMDEWRKIAGVPMKRYALVDRYFEAATDSVTTYVISLHPAAHGVTNKYFCDIGAWLGDRWNMETQS